MEFNNLIDFVDEQIYVVQGEVCGEPDTRMGHINYIVCLESIDEIPVKGRVLLKTATVDEFLYGDVLIFMAKLEYGFETETFSYKNYLKTFGIEAVVKSVSDIAVIDFKQSFLRSLYDFKLKQIKTIEYFLYEPYSSLANGLLFGLRKGFTEEMNLKFQITGLTHIIAVSGYNVSLVLLLVDKLLSFIPRQMRFYFLVVSVLAFMFLAGLSASVIRACVMGVLALIALQFGYSANIIRFILLTASLMIFYNPAYLYFDLGFQLSFFALLGILYIAPLIKIDWLKLPQGLKEALLLTVSAQLSTLPITIYHFGNLSLIAPMANLLVAPLLPLLMLGSFLILIVSFFEPLAYLMLLIQSGLFYLFFLIVNVMASVPFANVNFELQNTVIIVGVYSLYSLAVWIILKNKTNTNSHGK